jgi:hypothetical protein
MRRKSNQPDLRKSRPESHVEDFEDRSMVIRSPGWAVELRGTNFDLDDLRRELKAPADVWVEDDENSDGSKVLLRSKNWDVLTDVTDVHAQAIRLVEILSGALPLIQSDAQPAELGAVIRFDKEGHRHIYAIAMGAALMLAGGRVRAYVTGGEAVATPPNERRLQKWIASVELDDLRAEFFVHMSRADNWFDIYKAAELLRKIGGGHHAFKASLGKDEADLFDRVWLTANFHRHAPGLTNALPIPPADLSSARRFLHQIAARFL